MAFERNQTILELFIRTIQREYNHLVKLNELTPHTVDKTDICYETFFKLLKGEPLSIVKVLMDHSS